MSCMDCPRHPGVEASHACTLCGVESCGACLGSLSGQGSGRALRTCPACGGLSRAIERVTPPAEDFLDLARRPFTGEGLLTMAALAAPGALIGLPGSVLPRIFLVIYVGALAAYYFQVISHVGARRPGMPFSSDVTSRGDLVAAIGRGLACLLVGLGPFFAAALLAPSPPLMVAALMVGVLFMPASIVAVAITESALNGLWPPMMLAIVRRAPAAYVRLVGIFLVSTAAWWLGVGVAVATVGRIPLLGGFFVAVVSNVLVVLQAVLVGGFLRRHAAELGFD